ncbi:MAG: sigma 54-interacting transcriptional regulator, partial [Planctomycetaceae bacterium]|nr:sigma 54-interacting transcriptional regulator [Planctomycetaceae bacterium]
FFFFFYWWVFSSSQLLLLPFAVAAILLPAVLLHFFLLYPVPRRWLVQQTRWVLLAVYLILVTAAVLAVGIIVVGSRLSGADPLHPLGAIHDRLASTWTLSLLSYLRDGISAYLAVAAIYFLISIALLAYALLRSRQRVEHEQVRWILAAAAAAVAPLGYALWLAYAHRVELAFGGGQVPLFMASLLFTVAYAVGIVRHRLMLIDQVLNRGLLYYLVSFALTLLFSITLAYGTLATLHQDIGGAGQPVLVFVVAVVAVIMMIWLRDRLQRGIDREFFREKYQLDKALQRVNQAVTGMLDRKTLADRVLTSCQEVLQTDRGALYLRDERTPGFYRLAVNGGGQFPADFTASREFMETLRSGLSLQRVRSGQSPIQQSMRLLDAELVHGFDVDGTLAGMVVLGSKPNGASFNAEDAAFLAAMGRMAGVTLHFGRVHEELTRMNADFVRLNEELNQRSSIVDELRQQLQQKDDSLSQSQRQIEALNYQLSLQRPDEISAAGSDFEAPMILGNSSPIRSVLETVRKVANSEASVLIRGESGTGKELLARAIHDNSPRREGPLVTIHCAALAPGVLESELFGHVRGAFTDARQDKVGRFQMASGGTLFLDEIGDVPLETQVKLLRVLQERMIEPVGSSKPVPVDVRLMAATHRNLEEFIAAGRFREDLYYRLNVVSVTLPPLRDRGDDVIELAVKFLRRACLRTGKSVSHFDEAVLEMLRDYSWPGNIRELENAVERAVVLAEQDRIRLEDLPPVLQTTRVTARRGVAYRNPADVSTRPALSAPRPRESLAAAPAADLSSDAGMPPVIGSDEERQMLKEALGKARGNKARAARLLGMPRSTYFSKLRKHGLD